MFTNERTRFLSVLTALLLTIFLIAACDSGGGMNGDDNSPPNASVTANTTDPVVGDTVALDASKSDDPDGDELTFNWTLETPSGSDATLSSSTAARRWYVPDTSGDYRAEVEVGDSKLSDTDDVSMEALEKLPQTVTVPVENVAADGDSLITGAVTWEDSVVAEDVMSADVEIPASRNEGQLCFAENDLFAEGCKMLTPTSDFSEMQVISVQRKSVELTVIPDPPYGDPAETNVTVYEPFMADSTKFTGENTVELAKRKDGLVRQVATDLITDDPDKDGRLDRLTADATVTANSEVELSAQPTLLPACSDGINSDQDPFVKDKNDPGCFNDAGTAYDPEDDYELHSLRQRLTGVNFEDSVYVSGHPDERSVRIDESDFPRSVTVANGEVSHHFRNKRLSDISKQGFRIEVESKQCNASEYTYSQLSDKGADPDTANGWKNTRVHGLTRFGGRCYKLTLKKAQPYGGPKNIVLHYAPNEDNDLGQFIISYYYEPDHPELQGKDGKMAELNTTPKSGQCKIVAGGKARVCTNVKIADLPPLIHR
jgi:hypothetical protein